MKILCLSAYFEPERISSSKLSYDRNSAFASAGIMTELYVPTPTRGISDDVRKKYLTLKEEFLFDGHLHVYRYSMFREKSNSLIRAFRYFLCSIKQLYWGIRAKDIDVIFIASTPPINGLVGGILKKIKHVPLIYNLQDVFPDSLASLGYTKKSCVWKLGSLIESFTYKKSDTIIVISKDIRQNIINKGVSQEKIKLIYNWIDENAVHPVKKKLNPLYEEFNIIPDNFNVVYAGNLGNAQNIQILIDAAEKLESFNDINFIIFGTGGLESEIKEQILLKKLNNIRVFPLQPLDRVSYVYSLGDACVVSCKKGLGGSAMPSKSVTIMATGRPLLVNFDKGELEHLVKDNKCGLFSEAGNLEQFVESILTFYNNREMCEEYGKNARNLILAKFTKDVNVQKYVDVIKSFEKH